MRSLCLILLSITIPSSHAFYISHVFRFPDIPFSAGMHHIHSPAHFMESHGLTLPGFEIVSTSEPELHGDYISMEFVYRTHFNHRMTAKVFSCSLDTSHILLMDPDGIPSLLGRLRIDKCSSKGHLIETRANLLRPANVWERYFGGGISVKQYGVERSIRVGYTNVKYNRFDVNFKCYVKMVIAQAKERGELAGTE